MTDEERAAVFKLWVAHCMKVLPLIPIINGTNEHTAADDEMEEFRHELDDAIKELLPGSTRPYVTKDTFSGYYPLAADGLLFGYNGVNYALDYHDPLRIKENPE